MALSHLARSALRAHRLGDGFSRLKAPAGIAYPRTFHTSAVCCLKKKVEREENGVTVIENIIVDSPHKAHLLVKPSTAGAEVRECPLCRHNIQNVTHSDVLVISQFMDRKGNILPRKITGLCARQQRQVAIALYQAQRVGLIASERHAPKERWQELNNYFGTTVTKTDFGKPKINIWDFLKKPSGKKVWEA